MRTFVVNLKRNEDRWKVFQQNADKLGLQYERFDAVDGYVLPPDKLASFVDMRKARNLGYAMGRGEIGCALSHAGIYHKIVDESIPYSLILEDDSLPDKIVLQLLEELPNFINATDNFVVMLWDGRGRLDNLTKIHLPMTQLDMVRTHAPYSTVAYIITYEAAKRLSLFLPPVVSVADSWKRFEDYGLVRIWQILPCVIKLTELGKKSTLTHHDPRVNNTICQKIKRAFHQRIIRYIENFRALLYRWGMGYGL